MLPVDGIAVGAAVVGTGASVSPVDGLGVAVAEEPHAKMATSNRANGPRIIILGFFNQRFKTDKPPMEIGLDNLKHLAAISGYETGV